MIYELWYCVKYFLIVILFVSFMVLNEPYNKVSLHGTNNGCHRAEGFEKWFAANYYGVKGL